MNRLGCIVLAAAFVAGTGLVPARAAEKKEREKKEMTGRAEWRHRVMDLTDDQKDKLADIHDDAEEAILPLKIKEHKLLRKLSRQLTDKASDQDLSATLDDLKAARAAVRDAHQKFMDEAAAVFTPTQRARMALRMGRMMGMRQGWGGPGMGGPGMMMRAHGMMGGPGMGRGGPGMMMGRGDGACPYMAPQQKPEEGGDDDGD
ncbi:MAG: hypothetical protein KGL53_06890 [Elusimicrobia bacterium]|nr:hypothetical protein [Elusimicrobiota bacterium]